MRLPNLLYIGSDKAGSTWLYQLFRTHPEIYVPAIKDLYFFDRYYGRGFEWYASFYTGWADETYGVEVCHDYLRSEAAAARIGSLEPMPGVFSST